ncbi:amino acid deaminase/aldolase [Psychromicrobium lacuslunae]|uniref:Alanine racemase n=1 Tax=Psychromicrobium lacuslunae TaxID=1618207 RepID=A0A0D4C1K7_9MICC|nr:amino acid deaminase/aldolase [Psychromicrobium lacuslunae]AJT42483.1 alanine racemase [Psychromicrobium lacuslunae]
MFTLDQVALEAERSGTGRSEPEANFWPRADRATGHLAAPLGVLDRQALSANAGALLRRANGKPIRVASKSIRSREVLRAVLAQPGFAGVLAYTLPEALWLAEEFDDIVVAYPSADAPALRQLAADPQALSRITLMVDSGEQLDWMASILGSTTELRLCIDLDASWRPGLAGRQLGHIGVRRSPIRQPTQAVQLAERIARSGHRLVGIMSYEAQIAGLQDSPSNRARALLIQRLQSSSAQDILSRRAQVVSAVREVAELEFVNGGGTGSLELTSSDVSVTEIAAGSGLFGPTLFDHYSRFKPYPAVGFALQVVRRPAPDIITVLGGGWIASGPAGPDRVPLPVYPPGLSMIGTEGAGEVQTPLRGSAASGLRIADKVWFRHAKSGEICEHLDGLLVIDGEEVVAELPSYRGEGKVFL